METQALYHVLIAMKPATLLLMLNSCRAHTVSSVLELAIACQRRSADKFDGCWCKHHRVHIQVAYKRSAFCLNMFDSGTFQGLLLFAFVGFCFHINNQRSTIILNLPFTADSVGLSRDADAAMEVGCFHNTGPGRVCTCSSNSTSKKG